MAAAAAAAVDMVLDMVLEHTVVLVLPTVLVAVVANFRPKGSLSVLAIIKSEVLWIAAKTTTIIITMVIIIIRSVNCIYLGQKEILRGKTICQK